MGEAGGPEQLKPAVVVGVAGLEAVEQRVTRSPSTTSDARSGATASTSTRSDDGQDDGHEREEKDERGAADFRGLLQSMQRQLTFLHTMTRTIAREEKAGSPRRRGWPEASKEDAKQLEIHELDREPQVHECEEPEAESAIGDPVADSRETRTLQVELERLREQLATARQENAQLQATVERLQSGRSESQHPSDSETDAADASKQGAAACERIDDSRELERAASGTSIDHSVDPQQDADEVMRRGNVFMDWKPSEALKGHERCQEKTRELCETIRTLALYVQTYSQERSTLIAQRDDAIREAELAWAHNATLASSRNPQQKIKYLQQLKSDNGALRSKVRELQALLVERSLPRSASDASSSNQSQLELPQAIEAAHTETEECHERKHNELLRRLWSRREQLTAHLEQLERERGRARSGSSGGAETPRAAAMTSAPTSPRSLR